MNGYGVGVCGGPDGTGVYVGCPGANVSVGNPGLGVLVATPGRGVAVALGGCAGVPEMQQISPPGGWLRGYPSRHILSLPLHPHGPQLKSQRGGCVDGAIEYSNISI